jgi:hypothetical protein
MDALVRHSFVSGGRNPNYELTCGFPRCGYLIPHRDMRYDGGWCGHADNRVPPCYGWPAGFTPSVASTGGCDLHTSNAAGQGRREATYPEPACSALDSDEPDEREERCDSCGEVSCCLMRGLCPMCYEVNGGTHE